LFWKRDTRLRLRSCRVSSRKRSNATYRAPLSFRASKSLSRPLLSNIQSYCLPGRIREYHVGYLCIAFSERIPLAMPLLCICKNSSRTRSGIDGAWLLDSLRLNSRWWERGGGGGVGGLSDGARCRVPGKLVSTQMHRDETRFLMVAIQIPAKRQPRNPQPRVRRVVRSRRGVYRDLSR